MTDTDTDTDTLLQFHCHFPIKIFGRNSANYYEEIKALVRQHFPDTPDSAILCQPSQKANYLSITATVYVDSKTKLDALYQDLTKHPDIKMVL